MAWLKRLMAQTFVFLLNSCVYLQPFLEGDEPPSVYPRPHNIDLYSSFLQAASAPWCRLPDADMAAKQLEASGHDHHAAVPGAAKHL